MKIKEIIDHLESQGTWVNWNKSRDFVYYGDVENEIDKIGVCWVVTNHVLKQAIENNIHFIISHENMFYETTTLPTKDMMISANKKRQLLEEYSICVYRCHDVWDRMPGYGIVDSFAKDLSLPFEKRPTSSFYSYANIDMKLSELALIVKECVFKHHQEGIQVIGDLNKIVKRVAIGTGAITNIFEMKENECDVCVVSDDGINTWMHIQYSVDNDLPLIIVNHGASEMAGMKNMVHYLKEHFDIDVQYLDENIRLHIL